METREDNFGYLNVRRKIDYNGFLKQKIFLMKNILRERQTF